MCKIKNMHAYLKKIINHENLMHAKKVFVKYEYIFKKKYLCTDLSK